MIVINFQDFCNYVEANETKLFMCYIILFPLA